MRCFLISATILSFTADSAGKCRPPTTSVSTCATAGRHNSGAAALITNAAGAAKVTSIRGEAPELKLVLSLDGAADGALGFHETIVQAASDFTPAPTSADDPALMIYTSGTTGPPKG